MHVRVPDILCFLRIFLAFFLLALEPLSPQFLTLYTVCCVCDVLDGRIARWQDDCTDYGQTLDSMSDAVVAVVLLFCLVPSIPWDLWMILWIAVIAAIRLVSLGIGSGRFGRLAFVHTYLNKTAGFLLFLTPFMLFLLDTWIVVVIVCGITTVSAVEYLYLNLTEPELDRELRTAFGRHH